MYASIRRYTIEQERMSQFMRDIRQNFLPLISQVPGFISYEAVNAGDRLVTVSMFETKEGTSTELACDRRLRPCTPSVRL